MCLHCHHLLLNMAIWDVVELSVIPLYTVGNILSRMYLKKKKKNVHRHITITLFIHSYSN